MIRRHVLAALAAGVEAGDDDAARAAVARADWVLRGPARRRLERELVDAVLVTGELYTSADPDAMRHVHRAAALAVAGVVDVDSTDRARVAAAYRALAPAPVPRAPVATIAAAAMVALCVALGAWGVIALRTPHHRVRPHAPPVAGAFATGGAPARDPALERLFAAELADLVVESDGDRHGSGDAPCQQCDRGRGLRGADRSPARKAHLAELAGAPAIVAHGPALTAAWRDLLGALDASVDVPVHTAGFPEAREALREQAHAVSDQLAALGLGYYLDGDVFLDRQVAHAVVLAYRVEDVRFVHAATTRVRVLSLRRLDHLNLARAVLGMQSELLGDPVVMLDQIEEFVATHVAPVIAGAPYPVGDDMWRASWSGRRLAAGAGDAIRAELATGPGPGIERLAAVTASVRRHEARHAFDNDRARPLRYPAALAVYLGPRDTDPEVRRARAELAAYLSQIANDPVTPQLALWNVASQALQHERWGTPEAYAAVVILMGLAGRRDAVVVNGRLDRSRLADLSVPLAGLSDAALRDAARRLWTELYGESCLPIGE